MLRAPSPMPTRTASSCPEGGSTKNPPLDKAADWGYHRSRKGRRSRRSVPVGQHNCWPFGGYRAVSALLWCISTAQVLSKVKNVVLCTKSFAPSAPSPFTGSDWPIDLRRPSLPGWGAFIIAYLPNSVKLLLYKIWIDILRRFVILNICSKMLQKGPVAP